MSKTESQGSAKDLIGKIYSLIIFISEKTDSFSIADKDSILRKRKIAENWISGQAARYGIAVSFEASGCFGYQDSVIVNVIPSAVGNGDDYANWVSYLLGIIGWQSPIALFEKLKSETNSDNLHVEIYANKPGRSIAMACGEYDNKPLRFVEGFFCYQNFSNGVDLGPASIAHEMLHLYGAWDLYENYLVSPGQASYATIHYPNDIMRRNAHDINELEIGPLTAWRIGWAPMQEAWFEYFRPKNM